jgi:hypothetical protein
LTILQLSVNVNKIIIIKYDAETQMYNDGKFLAAAVTTGGGVASLPFTAGSSVFHTMLIATTAVSVVVLTVRIIKLTVERRSL